MGAILGQLVSMALGTVLQNVGDNQNQNGMIQTLLHRVSNSVNKKLNADEEVEKIASKNNSLKNF